MALKSLFEELRHFRHNDNLKSAKDDMKTLKEKIQKELNANRAEGPFKEKPFPNIQISPLGLVPKKSDNNAIPDSRVIHHLSFPEGQSINDGIPDNFRRVQYQNIDDTVELMQTFGPNCLIFQLDILNAYKIVPVHA